MRSENLAAATSQGHSDKAARAFSCAGALRHGGAPWWRAAIGAHRCGGV